MDTLINIHALLNTSRVNGPGLRAVVFFQGCKRACRGCFNPETHALDTRELLSAEAVFERLRGALPRVEGITVSGGEPFLQPAGLAVLLEKAKGLGLSTVVYTGFLIEEIRASEEMRQALPYIDVLIDGPFVMEAAEETLLARGSANQRFHFLTGRYTLKDFYMPGKVEITIGRDGTVSGTGFSRAPAGQGLGL